MHSGLKIAQFGIWQPFNYWQIIPQRVFRLIMKTAWGIIGTVCPTIEALKDFMLLFARDSFEASKLFYYFSVLPPMQGSFIT